MATKTTPTKPFPGPEMVTKLPPKTETIIPPTMAVMTPAIGGASLAIANPNPNGSAIRLTTKPENIFLGKSFMNPRKEVSFVFIGQLIHRLVIQLKYILCRAEKRGPKTSFLQAHSLRVNLHAQLVRNALSNSLAFQK